MSNGAFTSQPHATDTAKKIYGLSQSCLMAHSIRATEQYLSRVYQRPHHIVLLETDYDVTGVGRDSACLPGAASSRIFVKASMEHDKKRFCIAHELYHLLRHIDDKKAGIVRSNQTQAQNKELEEVADIFAHELCSMHHEFYSTQKNVDEHCKFKKLNYSSLEGLSA